MRCQGNSLCNVGQSLCVEVKGKRSEGLPPHLQDPGVLAGVSRAQVPGLDGFGEGLGKARWVLCHTTALRLS